MGIPIPVFLKKKIQELVKWAKYKPNKFYMRGRPGPACREKRSLQKQQSGRDSRLAVAPSGMTRVSPDSHHSVRG